MPKAFATDDPAPRGSDETCVPHLGWLEHAAGDDVATYLRQGWFEYAEQAFMWLYLRPGDVFVDCGSHVGLYSVLATRVMGGSGRVLAIEPNPETVMRLRRNLEANGAMVATVHSVAVAAGEGTMTLHAASGVKSAYSSLVIPIKDASPVLVPTVTLDGLLEREQIRDIAFLKLDVEGAELDVMDGAASLIESNRLSVAMVEFTEANLTASGRTSVELASAWTRRGYGWFQLDESSLQLVPAEIKGPVEYANYFAVRDIAPVNERLRSATAEHQRTAREVVHRGRSAFSLLKRACDAEHLQAWWHAEHQELTTQLTEVTAALETLQAAWWTRLGKVLRVLKRVRSMEEESPSNPLTEDAAPHERLLVANSSLERPPEEVEKELRRTEVRRASTEAPPGVRITDSRDDASGLDTPAVTEQLLLDQIGRYNFYHTIKLTDTVSTPGVPDFVPLHAPVYRVMDRVDFTGCSVLDIGCRDGLFSFEAERRGAASIVGIDNCLSRGAIELIIPFLKSKVRMLELGLYELTPERFGRFDVVLFLGVLYHLRYPFYALRVIAEVLEDGGTLIVETAIHADDGALAILFCPTGDEGPYEPSSCTFFNQKGMIDTLRSLGLGVQHVEYMDERHRSLTGGEVIRCTFLCRKDSALLAEYPHEYWLGGTHRTWRKRGDV